jgi:hypothetical protein
MISLTWAQVWARRLDRHSLTGRAPAEQLVEVAGNICGIHAQIMKAAELSLGVRLAGVTGRDVQASLWARRDLVKTYGLRGTVHLFRARELSLWMAALQTRLPSDRPRLARMGLDVGRREAVVEAIRNALDGQRLTLRQLGDAVIEQLGAWAGEETAPAFGGMWPLWRMALGSAASAGALCFGPNTGSSVTYVRPDQWLGSWQDIDPREALGRVFLRYLWAYGPATPRDFAQWFSIPVPLAADVVRGIDDALEEVDVEGYGCLQLAGEESAPEAGAGESIRLLPHFDCYVVGCHPRSQLVPPAWTHRALEHGGAGPIPLLVVNGVVAGVWKQSRKGRHVEVQVDPFTPLPDRQVDCLQTEVRHLGEVLEAEAALVIGPFDVRPHL